MFIIALVNKLKAIADSIRDKTGETNPLTLDDMPVAISEMQTGGSEITDLYIVEIYDSDGNLIDAKMHGYTKIRKFAFYDYTNLASTSLPSTITSIGDSAFYDCTNLTTINVPWAEGAVANAP